MYCAQEKSSFGAQQEVDLYRRQSDLSGASDIEETCPRSLDTGGGDEGWSPRLGGFHEREKF